MHDLCDQLSPQEQITVEKAAFIIMQFLQLLLLLLLLLRRFYLVCHLEHQPWTSCKIETIVQIVTYILQGSQLDND